MKGCPNHVIFQNLDPLRLRKTLLTSRPFVDISSLIAFLWGVGIPVIHLRINPLASKHMCAMSVRVGDRYAILLARDSSYPAPTAFHLAHEIAHILLGHLPGDGSIVDMVGPEERVDENDPEEIAADRFALELLTGNPDTFVENIGIGRSARQLATEVIRVGHAYAIEPGTLALCYGFSSKDWGVANKSMHYIYNQPSPVWEVINKIAIKQLEWEEISDESSAYLRAVVGGIN